MSIDWSEAPEGTTHLGPNGCWYKIYGDSVNCWYGDRWSKTYCLSEYSKEFHRFTVCPHPAESLEKYHQWCGRIYRLPPIGSTVRIDKGDRIIWQDAEMFIGVDVTLVATFKTGDTQMVAVEHPVEKQCCCFLADMVRTLEQIEAEARKDTISKMLRYAAITGESFRDVCGKMYDAGLRFEVKP